MIIVLESLDEYTKGVQAQLLCDSLNEKGITATMCQSTLPDGVKSALNEATKGTFLDDNNSVYVNTVLRASERFMKVHKDEGVNRDEEISVFDNYTCSNILNQMRMIEVAEWDKYIEWALDLEYNKLSVPEPDVIIYLSIDTIAYKTTDTKLNNMVQKSAAAKYCANKLGWNVVDCCKNGVYRDKDSINAEIVKIVEDYYGLNCEIKGKKKFCYYITYSKENNGFGSLTINYNKKIDTQERIREVNELLNKKLKGRCVIVNVMELSGVSNNVPVDNTKKNKKK